LQGTDVDQTESREELTESQGENQQIIENKNDHRSAKDILKKQFK